VEQTVSVRWREGTWPSFRDPVQECGATAAVFVGSRRRQDTGDEVEVALVIPGRARGTMIPVAWLELPDGFC
jgi:hypothetical protein